jgi:DNA-binding transcriptional ArsR family regulator
LPVKEKEEAMATQLLTERYAEAISGVLESYDRLVLSGHLQPLSYAQGMTSYLYREGIRIFDYTAFAEPLRNLIRSNAERLAQENGINIEFISKGQAMRKEDHIQARIETRGGQAGLVHILSAMESCNAYEPWHDKASGKTYVRSTSGKCLHYYFYFIDEALGLCYLRVPTWSPFRLQFYCNGHNVLADRLHQAGIAAHLLDNAFVQIADFEQANRLAADWQSEQLHAKLDEYAQAYCPVVTQLNLRYSWSLMQVEYATDIVFKEQAVLQSFYTLLVERLVQAVKPADIATFLGRKLHGNYQDEMGNRFNQRWLGTRLKHQMGPVTLKLYDKFNLVLRIEVTVNDVSFFDQRREVKHRDGTTSIEWTTMKKSIYSLRPLQEVLRAVNQRYLKFISAIDTPQLGVKKLDQLTQTHVENQHRYKGFQLLSEEDSSLFRLLLSGDLVINGISNRRLRAALPGKSIAQISHLLKRLRVHGLLTKVKRSYKYYLSDLGRQVAALVLTLRSVVIIPALAR